MNPDLYLPLARAYRERGMERATEFYVKFLAARPDDPEAPRALRELRAIDPELAGVFPSARRPAPEPTSGMQPAALGALFGLVLAAGLFLTGFWALGRGVSLERLARESPELHPAIAYLVGGLRHELLKHRIGAVRDVLAAFARGEATAEQRAFLRRRLFGGVPLRRAWDGHRRAFERALGHRLDLRRDRGFRGAERAIAALVRLEPRFVAVGGAPDDRVARRLERAHARLRAFDRDLAALVTRLVRTRLDEKLLEQVVEEVRGEYAAGSVALDELSIEPPPGRIEVEVFRVDLVLILKNLVRNAILAVARSEPPRRVGLDVRVDLEPTGEEVVRVRVRDSSEETIDGGALAERRVDRGLGLVGAALARYDGSIEIEPGEGGWSKGVTVRFFRAFGEEDEPSGLRVRSESEAVDLGERAHERAGTTEAGVP